MKNLIFTFLFSLLSVTAFSQSESTALVIKLRGNVSYKIDGKVKKLKKGSKIPQGAIVTSSKKSFAIIKMVDETKLTLGPDSSIEIQELSKKNKPGIISLLKGQLRSKVKPDKVKKGNKLFIKANMAALGVRGTETVITFNPKNNSFTTGGLTGKVLIVPLKESQKLTVKDLQSIITKKNPNVIELPKKYFSSIKVSKNSFKISKPQMMNSIQYYALLKNAVPKINNKQGKKVKNMRSILLPNMPTKESDPIVTTAINPDVKSEVASERREAVNIDPGVSDSGSTPVAGAMVDFVTGTIINPSSTDPVDSNSGQRIPSSNMGQIASDGSYIPPKGLILTSEGAFTYDTSYDDNGRMVASVEEVDIPKIPKIDEINVVFLEFTDGDTIEQQNSQVSNPQENDISIASESSYDLDDQELANNTAVDDQEGFSDNVINVENDCPNRKLCDNFDSVSPTTTDSITKTAVQFNIIIRK